LIINDINTISTAFKNRTSFTKNDLLKVLQEIYPETTTNTIKWKIHDLKEKGVIRHLTRGVYSLTENKRSYAPDIPEEARKIYNDIRQELPYTDLSISYTGWFNEFMLHQVFRTYLIIEVEKEATPTVFKRLIELSDEVFLNPRKEMFEYYIANTENPIIIKPLISESPLIEVDQIRVASLEKLLVDCICDTEVYGAQYQEATAIFENAMEKYTINTGRIRRYARRRNRSVEIAGFLNKNEWYD
jgi:predicted transcriptional regulator of viral defense system